MMIVLETTSLQGAEEAPAFDLPRWNSQERVSLKDFSGSIVVLDFFAYWCVPCRKTSAEIEKEIQVHYNTSGGNPQGVPVVVLAVNIERANPRLTAKFVADTGVSSVVNDHDGALLASLGGAATPYIVVIDGASAPGFHVVYRHAGYEGAAHLRQIIDGIGTRAAPDRAESPVATSLPTLFKSDLSFEYGTSIWHSKPLG